MLDLRILLDDDNGNHHLSNPPREEPVTKYFNPAKTVKGVPYTHSSQSMLV
jgi:hypothetical protein